MYRIKIISKQPYKSHISCKLTLWEDGVDSKFVLKRESINVDFPRPVSPTKIFKITYFPSLLAIAGSIYTAFNLYLTKYLPMHITLNVNPAATLWLTSWSGSESNPTCPPSCRFRNFGLVDPDELDPFSAP